MSLLPRPISVCVAVPMSDGMTNTALTMFMPEAAKWGAQQKPRKYVFSLMCNHFLRPVELARNELVGRFLASDADYLWFIDADMIPRDATLRIFDVDADIVGGRAHIAFDEVGVKSGLKCSAFTKEETSHKFVNILPTTQQMATPVDVDALGCACLLVKRKVLEDRRMWLDAAYTDPDGAACVLGTVDDKGQPVPPPVFRSLYAPNGQLLRGEDMDFTWRAKQLGYSVQFYYPAEIGHFKRVDIDMVERAAKEAIIKHADMVSERMLEMKLQQHKLKEAVNG